MRIIGMDIHRAFAEAVMLDGDKLIRLRVNMSRDHLAAFAAKLTHEDHIVVEATGNAQAVVEAVAPLVGRVVIANPRRSLNRFFKAIAALNQRRDNAAQIHLCLSIADVVARNHPHRESDRRQLEYPLRPGTCPGYAWD